MTFTPENLPVQTPFNLTPRWAETGQNMDIDSAFRYEPLGSNDGAFRLVLLLPGNDDSQISCKLLRASFSEDPEYTALSYMWGSTLDKRTIYVDDQLMDVTDNLWSALNTLRSSTELRTLWIDAICIDQASVEERNHQVGQMGLIYSRASKVLVWLGHISASSDERLFCLDMIFQWISKVSGEPWPDNPDPFRLVDALKDISQGAKSARRRYCGSLRLSAEIVGDIWREFVEFCSLEYWHRVWIVQEIVLAQDIEIQMGSWKANWSGLAAIFKYLGQSFPDAEPQPIQQIHNSLPVEFQRQRTKTVTSRGSNLESLLRSTERSICTDPRDKVFALLSLAKDCSNHEIDADYSKSVSDLYVDVMRLYISRDHESKILQFSNLLQRTLGVFQLTRDNVSSFPSGFRVSAIRRSKLIYIGQPWKTTPPGNWLITRNSPHSRFFGMMDQLEAKVVEGKGHTCLNYFTGDGGQKLISTNLSRWYNESKGPKMRESHRDSIRGLVAHFDTSEMNTMKKKNLPQLKEEWKAEHIKAFENQLIAVDEHGDLGLVPPNAQFGDEVVEYENCDLSIVTRKVSKQRIAIGTCFMAKVDWSKDSILESDMADGQQTGKNVAVFDLDNFTLKLLTERCFGSNSTSGFWRLDDRGWHGYRLLEPI